MERDDHIEIEVDIDERVGELGKAQVAAGALSMEEFLRGDRTYRQVDEEEKP